MVNQVKTPIQNYFEKVLYENLTFEIPHLWFLRVVSWALRWGIKKNRNKPPGCACGLIDRNKCLCVKFYENNNKTKNHCHIELSIIHTTKQVFKKLSRNKSNQTADLVLNQTWHLNQIWQNNPQIGSSQVVHS
jgi:hypothetical protein